MTTISMVIFYINQFSYFFSVFVLLEIALHQTVSPAQLEQVPSKRTYLLFTTDTSSYEVTPSAIIPIKFFLDNFVTLGKTKTDPQSEFLRLYTTYEGRFLGYIPYSTPTTVLYALYVVQLGIL